MRKILASALSVLCLAAVALPTPSLAQTNDNDYTPLNSRIRHDRQFPLDPPPHFVPSERMDKVERDQTKSMENQFSKCLYHRSMEDSLALLDKTDFGFSDFAQIGLDGNKAMRIYGFSDCLERVAATHNTSVAMRFYPPNLRQWLIHAAYLDRYPKGPTWLRPGYLIQPRSFPLSPGNPSVKAQMDLADCVVATDPNNADFFFRTVSGSEDEKEAIDKLAPELGPCVPQGVQLQISPALLRAWIAEGLWQAANHSAPAPAGG